MAILDYQVGYIAGASLPDLHVWWMDPDAAGLTDFSSGWTFQIDVDQVDGTDSFTKASGTTGATGSGTGQEPGDIPNLVIAWATSAEITTLSPGTYTLEISATRTADSKIRKRQLALRITPTV